MQAALVLILLFSSAVLLGGCAPALISAVTRGDINSVKTLLEQGTDVNVKDGHGNTALFTAVENDRVDIAKILLAKGADINAKGEVWTFVLHPYDLDKPVETRSWGGGTALIVAACRGNKEIADILLAQGADVNAKDICGGTALTCAAAYDHIEIARILLAKGADVNVMGCGGYAALDWAEKKENKEMIDLLKKAGAKESKPGPLLESFYGEGNSGAVENGSIDQSNLNLEYRKVIKRNPAK